MSEQLELLWQIQFLEQEIQKYKKLQNSLNTEEIRALWQEVKMFSQTVIEKETEVDKLKQLLQKIEQEINNLSCQLREKEGILYNGCVVNVKELSKIQSQAAEIKNILENREETAFKQMEKLETLQSELVQKQNQLFTRKQQHVEKQQEYANKLKSYEQNLTDISNEYKVLAAKVNPELLQLYRSLKTKFSLPIARINNSICTGCHVGLPENHINKNKQAIQYCDHCGRILLID